ncbi:hypothetical protein [Bradymonas sediminis]|uniref:Uncharacterized protein n=1 Tax=Bradymonas sediminis TaxID=1548548 RepID=A0A2Z4FJI0_9DELT|nr:hypothetical protein [Bradymonas sediminis]AWV89167.1 hypothetical protein DN745_07375 [Bradymonas sediminis]TDP64366.1 hypothetical protein DFR33_10927 [Bradymonas sediminis]
MANSPTKSTLGVSLFVASAFLLSACASSVYHLPPPPTPAGQAAAAADGEASAVDDEALDAAARASLLKLYELVKREQYEEAEQYLSQETRDFLSAASGVNDPSALLSSGEFKHRDGRVLQVNPVNLLFGGNIVSVRDALKEADEGETANRRVLYVIDPQEVSHRVIMISEGGKWVLHTTSISADGARLAQ